MDNSGIVIFGGGTFNHVACHLSLSAVAFGETARRFHSKWFPGSRLILTKMADYTSKIVTNDDLMNEVELVVSDPSVKVIIMTCAVCDFTAMTDTTEKRLSSKDVHTIKLIPAPKILSVIRQRRPDIFLVGFKATCGDTVQQQFEKALYMMKSTKCNLVLANDVETLSNFIVTPEETMYRYSNRHITLTQLVAMIISRSQLTYHSTVLVSTPNTRMDSMPPTFTTVVQYLIDRGGFQCNNGNGFTPGHFCVNDSANKVMYSSQRKVNHNNVFNHNVNYDIVMGLTKVDYSGSNRIAYGTRKPSVGATSQILLFNALPQYDCIVHTHSDLKDVDQSRIVHRPQWRYQCGSIECGENTLAGMTEYTINDTTIHAVFLDKHGPVVMFNSSSNPTDIITFYETHFNINQKIQ